MDETPKHQPKLDELIAEGFASKLVVINPKFWEQLEIKLFGKAKVHNPEK
jgi:hypothetical protein